MRKTGLLGLVVLMLVVVIAAGCSNGDKDNGNAANGGKQEPVSTGNDADKNGDGAAEESISWFFDEKLNPPVTITQNFVIPNVTLQEMAKRGEAMDDSPYTRRLAAEAGIQYKVKWIVPEQDVNTERFNLAVASRDLPDIIEAPANQLVELAKAGALTPLDDLIEKYGSPLTKHVIGEFQKATQDTFFTPFSYDGKLYMMPIFWDVWAGVAKANWIREDVVQELGASVPATLAEYEQLIAAYKTKYPKGVALGLWVDGNGIGGMEPVMQAFGAYTGAWYNDGSGNLVYGSVQPQVKQGLAVLRDWYAKGWLDREFIAKDFSKVSEQLVAGNLLSHHNSWGNVWFPFPDMFKNNPQATMTSFAPLKGPDGQNGSIMLNRAYSGLTTSYAVNASFAHPELAIKQLNESMDWKFRTDLALRKLMKEQYDYDFKYAETLPNGDPIEVATGIGFRVNQRATDLLDRYNTIIAAEEAGTMSTLTAEQQDEHMRMNAVSPEQWKSHVKNMKLWNRLSSEGRIAYNEFIGSPTPAMSDNNAYLSKLEQETFAKIIMGGYPLDQFDQFVQEWLKSGGEQITKEVNEWYKASRP